MSSELANCLIDTFNREGVNYCHWKSNVDLAHAISAEMDLDFLIDRESLLPAISILSRFGFKSAEVRWGLNPPGIFHYYGYDPAIGEFVHVHLFSRVITGESFLKSHRLPFEQMLLQNTRCEGQMRVASKPAELVLFTVRTFIKYGSLPDFLYLLKKKDKIKSELQWLKNGGSINQSICLLNKYCPVIDEELFLQCINCLEGDGSITQRIRLAQKVRARIRGYAKYTFLERGISYIQLIFDQARYRLRSGGKNKVLNSGGSVIAIIGADATGKSTLVSEMGRWLGKNLSVRILHAGKPPTSWLTSPANLLFRHTQRYKSKLHSNNGETQYPTGEKNNARSGKGLTSLIYAFRAVTLAYDRRNLLQKGWRSAAKGEIIICDRYPSNIVGAMDSPRLQGTTMHGGWLTFLYNIAAGFEKRLYTQIPPPDLVLRLHVSVETAKERNNERDKLGEESNEYIETRHLLSGEWHRPEVVKVFDVDTGQPLAETLYKVKDIIWQAL